MKLRVTTRLIIMVAFMLICASATYVLAQRQTDFYLEVTIVTGEHSRDSNSTTRTLTASPGKLIYKETYDGARSGQHPPVEKQFKLTPQDQSDLTALLETKTC